MTKKVSMILLTSASILFLMVTSISFSGCSYWTKLQESCNSLNVLNLVFATVDAQDFQLAAGIVGDRDLFGNVINTSPENAKDFELIKNAQSRKQLGQLISKDLNLKLSSMHIIKGSIQGRCAMQIATTSGGLSKITYDYYTKNSEVYVTNVTQ